MQSPSRRSAREPLARTEEDGRHSLPQASPGEPADFSAGIAESTDRAQAGRLGRAILWQGFPMIAWVRRLARVPALVTGLAGLAALAVSGDGQARAAPAERKPGVAVLYFDYSGKDEQLVVLRKGLAQMMISDLSAIDAVQLVERDRLEDVLAELKLGQTARIDPATAARAGKLLGARLVVIGGYFDLKRTLRVDARVVEVETGKVVQSVGATGDPDDFLALEQKLVGQIGASLAKQLALLPPQSPARPRVKPPSRLARHVALLYSQALDDLDSRDRRAAKAKLTQVVEQQPDFALATLDLNKLLQ
jgi:TolB-like protein